MTTNAVPVTASQAEPAHPVVVIEPARGWIPLRLGELWEYRELLFFLTWRDVKVRYQQTALGAAWAILQPLLTMVVFSIFFGRLAKVPSDALPYPLFSFTGLVPWSYFATALAQSANSLVDHGRLITKVYFPRLLVPMAAVTAGLVDMAVSLIVLLLLLAHYHVPAQPRLLLLPLFVLLAVTTALAVGLWLSALNVQYRDVRYTIPFLIQFWLFATPVAYPSSLLPARWRALYGLNPMAGVVEGFRWSLLPDAPSPGPLLLVSVAAVSGLLVGGLFFFRRMERRFADVV